jgi:hypothetical protein
MASTHRQSSSKSRRSHHTPPPRIIKLEHGGKREGSGRPQRVPCEWPENVDLKSAIGVDKFLRQVIEDAWKENVLDARMLSALNSTIKLLLDLRGWIRVDSASFDDPVDEDDGKNDFEVEPEGQFEFMTKTRDEIQEIAANTQAILDDPTVPENIKKSARAVLDMTQKSNAASQCPEKQRLIEQEAA